MKETSKRSRRCARYISQQDRQALEQGKTPSWEETASGIEVSSAPEVGEDNSNDERLITNVPPHW